VVYKGEDIDKYAKGMEIELAVLVYNFKTKGRHTLENYSETLITAKTPLYYNILP